MIRNIKTTRLFLNGLFLVLVLVLVTSFLVATEYTLANDGTLDNANYSSDDADVSYEGNDDSDAINDNVDAPLDEMDQEVFCSPDTIPMEEGLVKEEKEALEENESVDTVTVSAPAMNNTDPASTPEPLKIEKEGTDFYLRGGTESDYMSENWIQQVGEKKYIIDAESHKVITGIQQIEDIDYYAYVSTEDEAGYLAEDADALYPIEEDYYYIKNGQVNTYTGIVHKSDEPGWYSVKNGIYVPDFTGLAMREDNGKYYYVENGKYTQGFHGIARKIDEESGWFYAKKSKYRPNFTGLANKPGTENYYFVIDGKYDKSFTGLAKSAHAKGYYYAENGKYKRTYTGLTTKIDDEGWYFAKKGKYNTTFKGLARKPGTTNYYYVEDGIYTEGFKGFAKSAHAKGYYYAVKSKYDNTFTGLAWSDYGDGYYFAKKGKYDKTYTGLAQSAHAKGYYYAKKGKYDKTFTGVAKCINDNKAYYVVNGKYNLEKKSQYIKVGKNLYYAGKTGALQSGWVKHNKETRYFDPKTYKSVKDKTVDKLYINANGVVTDAAIKARDILDKIGWNLKKAYAYCRDLPYKRLFGDQSLNGTTWCANYLFDNKEGNCYCKAAGFWYLAKTIGYDGLNFVAGTAHSSYHGWCEVKEDGVLYLFDPTGDDAAHGWNNNGSGGTYYSYHVPYGSPNTFRFDKGYRVVGL